MVDFDSFRFAIMVVGMLLSAIIAYYGVGVIIAYRKAREEMIKARLFLKPRFMITTYAYSISTGGFFILHQVFSALREFRGIEIEWVRIIIEVGFAVSFLLMTRNWYVITRECVPKGK
ncbi:hypothetical protein KKA03_02840 [archaeon]|nr:hypothetical protein [archaeon]